MLEVPYPEPDGQLVYTASTPASPPKPDSEEDNLHPAARQVLVVLYGLLGHCWVSCGWCGNPMFLGQPAPEMLSALNTPWCTMCEVREVRNESVLRELPNLTGFRFVNLRLFGTHLIWNTPLNARNLYQQAIYKGIPFIVGQVECLSSLFENFGVGHQMEKCNCDQFSFSRWWQLKHFLFSPRKLGK